MSALLTTITDVVVCRLGVIKPTFVLPMIDACEQEVE
jgi:hypothetical protein